MKVRPKLLLALLTVSVLPLAFYAVVSFLLAQQYLKDSSTQRLENLVEVERTEVKTVLDRYLESASILAHNKLTVRDMDSYSTAKGPAEQKAATKKLDQLISDNAQVSLGKISKISFLNKAGTVIASSDKNQIGNDLESDDTFTLGKRKESLISLYKDTNGNVISIVAAPIFQDDSFEGVVAIERGIPEINVITNNYDQLGRTGESFLIQHDLNGNLVFITPVRFGSSDLLTHPNVSDDFSNLAEQALIWHNGVVTQGTDYRGKEVFAVTRYIAGYNWGLMVKVDQDELYAPINNFRNTLLLVTGLVAVICMLLSLDFARLFTRPLTHLFQYFSQVDLSNPDTFPKNLQLSTQDEFAALGRVFEQLFQKISLLYKQVGEVKVEASHETSEMSVKLNELEGTKKATLNILEDLEAAKNNVEREKAKDDALLSSIGDGMVVTDAEMHVQLINQAGLDMLGYSQEEVIGKKWTVDVPAVIDDAGNDLSLPVHATYIALSTQKKAVGQYVYKRKDGTTLPVAVTANPVLLNDKITGGITLFKDVTKEREVDRMKTEFISLASHQLRTPLSGIKWFAEILLDQEVGKLTKEQLDVAQNIYDSNERMIGLVNSLLNISRIESGRIIIDPQPTDLKKMVQDIITELTPRFEKKKQKIAMSIHENLPKISVDPRLIEQVYVNLLTNAIKYSPDGSEIMVMISKNDKDVVSQVSDNGYGIPKKQQDKLFAKFFRAENIVKIETDGTGLGLYLTKAIVESSGGKIWFESEEGKGTTFWFSLPLSGSIAKKGEVTIDS